MAAETSRRDDGTPATCTPTPARRATTCASSVRSAGRPSRRPSLRYDDFPREVPKREIRVDEAAQRIANALHLHLD